MELPQLIHYQHRLRLSLRLIDVGIQQLRIGALPDP
jgi:hypothetical protein